MDASGMIHIHWFWFLLITFGVTGIGFLAGYFICAAFVGQEREDLLRKNAIIRNLTRRVIEAEGK